MGWDTPFWYFHSDNHRSFKDDLNGSCGFGWFFFSRNFRVCVIALSLYPCGSPVSYSARITERGLILFSRIPLAVTAAREPRIFNAPPLFHRCRSRYCEWTLQVRVRPHSQARRPSEETNIKIRSVTAIDDGKDGNVRIRWIVWFPINRFRTVAADRHDNAWEQCLM